MAPKSCHVQNGEVRWASHCWGHSLQPSNKLKPKNQLYCTFKRATATWFFCFWKFCDTWWISWKKHWGILENEVLTSAQSAYHFLKCPTGSYALEACLQIHKKNLRFFVSLECCTWWTFLQNEVPKTLTLKQIHTSDTKNNVGSLQVWSFHLMNIPMKCENNEVPKKLTLKQFHPHLIQESLSMSMTSKVVSKLFSHPCLGLFQCITSKVMCKLFSHPCLKTWNG